MAELKRIMFIAGLILSAVEGARAAEPWTEVVESCLATYRRSVTAASDKHRETWSRIVEQNIRFDQPESTEDLARFRRLKNEIPRSTSFEDRYTRSVSARSFPVPWNYSEINTLKKLAAVMTTADAAQIVALKSKFSAEALGSALREVRSTPSCTRLEMKLGIVHPILGARSESETLGGAWEKVLFLVNECAPDRLLEVRRGILAMPKPRARRRRIYGRPPRRPGDRCGNQLLRIKVLRTFKR